ncbi:unnamed protein product [Rotaria sp. Silwood2]|nr:unnamed protein product [Rotaria sp. Silwood2]
MTSSISFDVDRNESTTRVKRARIDEFYIGTFQSKSRLEDLPNELLFYICQCLPLIDLQRAFYNLNLRLNTILYSEKFKLDFSMISMLKYAFDYYCSNQQLFVTQIYSLKLCDEYDRVTWFNRHIDMSLFKNLRALTILQPSIENLDKILSKLYLLTNLSYLNIYDALIQSPYITAVLFSIRSLKRLILYSLDPILFHFNDNTIHPWTELEYLKLNSCYMANFLELVKYVGKNVQRMAISIVSKHHEDPTSIDQKIIDNLLYGDGLQLSGKKNFVLEQCIIYK